MKLYDEREALDYIRKHVSCQAIGDDILFDIIDAIFDYYDINGKLDIDFDDDDEFDDDDPEAIFRHVILSLDEELPDTLLHDIIDAELAYEATLL